MPSSSRTSRTAACSKRLAGIDVAGGGDRLAVRPEAFGLRPVLDVDLTGRVDQSDIDARLLDARRLVGPLVIDKSIEQDAFALPQQKIHSLRLVHQFSLAGLSSSYRPPRCLARNFSAAA